MPDKTANLVGRQLAQDFGIPVPLDAVRLQICDLKDPKKYDPQCSDFGKKDFPTVLFSPGHHDSRLYFGAQAAAMASLGYVIITIVSGTTYNVCG